MRAARPLTRSARVPMAALLLLPAWSITGCSRSIGATHDADASQASISDAGQVATETMSDTTSRADDAGNEDATSPADDAGNDQVSDAGSIGGGPYDHRPRPVTCGPGMQPASQMTKAWFACRQHSDCQERPFGRCSSSHRCSYDECWTDEDCGPGMLCSCPDHPQASFNYATCVNAGCRTDADCPGDALCRPSVVLGCGHGLGGYFCPTPQDECATDADCPGRDYCAYDSDASRWVCEHRRCYVP